MNNSLNEMTADKGFASKEVKEICTNFTTDVITSVAFGIGANISKDPTLGFKKKIETLFSSSPLKTIHFLTVFFAPTLAKYIRPKLFSRNSKDFLENTIKSVIESKEHSENSRNDLIDILIGLRKESLEFTDNAIISQVALFFSSGFESASSTMSFALYELAKNQDTQKKLRDEIKHTLSENEGMITYEVVTMGMPYLNNVVQEVLRLYPVVPFVDREVTLLEGETEYNFEPFGDYKAPNGTPVYIPIVSIHRSRKFFRNPNTFDPDRFSSERRSEIISGTYLPFGIGPRNCIGERFGLLQVKVGLINFLKGHSIKFNAKNPKEMVFNNNINVLQAKEGIFLDIVKEC